jgi:hypothetical protein
MPRYLSPEWLAAADAALAGDASLRAATAGLHLSVEQVVTGGPDGDVTYHVAADDGAVRITPGRAAVPTVTFTQDYATAAAVGSGALSAQGAFMTGRIRIRGELERLVAYSDAFSEIDDVLAPLRAETVY